MAEKFEREQFADNEQNAKDARDALEEKKTSKEELQKNIAELSAKEHIDPEEIISLAKRIQSENKEIKKEENILNDVKKRHGALYEAARDYAIMNNELRDALKLAIKDNDYSKIIEVAEKLKQQDNIKENPKVYDAEGTQKLYKKFASEFRNIAGLIEGKARVQLDNDRHAFIDQDGKIASQEYKDVWPYSEGKALVRFDNGRYAFMDQDGKIVSQEYKDVWSYSEGKARVQLDNGRWVFIDQDGKIVSQEYEYVWSYSEGKARVQLDNGRYAFIDQDGKIILFIENKL